MPASWPATCARRRSSARPTTAPSTSSSPIRRGPSSTKVTPRRRCSAALPHRAVFADDATVVLEHAARTAPPEVDALVRGRAPAATATPPSRSTNPLYSPPPRRSPEAHFRMSPPSSRPPDAASPSRAETPSTPSSPSCCCSAPAASSPARQSNKPRRRRPSAPGAQHLGVGSVAADQPAARRHSPPPPPDESSPRAGTSPTSSTCPRAAAARASAPACPARARAGAAGPRRPGPALLQQRARERLVAQGPREHRRAASAPRATSAPPAVAANDMGSPAVAPVRGQHLPLRGSYPRPARRAASTPPCPCRSCPRGSDRLEGGMKARALAGPRRSSASPSPRRSRAGARARSLHLRHHPELRRRRPTHASPADAGPPTRETRRGGADAASRDGGSTAPGGR